MNLFERLTEADDSGLQSKLDALAADVKKLLDRSSVSGYSSGRHKSAWRAGVFEPGFNWYALVPEPRSLKTTVDQHGKAEVFASRGSAHKTFKLTKAGLQKALKFTGLKV